MLAHPEDHAIALTLVFLVALPLGLLGNLAVPVFGRDPYNPLTYSRLWPAIVALAVGYATGLLLLIPTQAWRERVTGLSWLGRMPLTIFLLQWLCIQAIYDGFGLGLRGTLGTAASIPLTLSLFGVHIVLARWWLSRFRFGSAEWCWRVVTYGPARLRIARQRTRVNECRSWATLGRFLEVAATIEAWRTEQPGEWKSPGLIDNPNSFAYMRSREGEGIEKRDQRDSGASSTRSSSLRRGSSPTSLAGKSVNGIRSAAQ